MRLKGFKQYAYDDTRIAKGDQFLTCRGYERLRGMLKIDKKDFCDSSFLSWAFYV